MKLDRVAANDGLADAAITAARVAKASPRCTKLVSIVGNGPESSGAVASRFSMSEASFPTAVFIPPLRADASARARSIRSGAEPLIVTTPPVLLVKVTPSG